MLEKFKQYFSILADLDVETELIESWIHSNIVNCLDDEFTIVDNDEERLVLVYDVHGDSDENPFKFYETKGDVIIVERDDDVILVFNKNNQVIQ
jgi:hypothetical protein